MSEHGLGQPPPQRPSWIYIGFSWGVDALASAKLVDFLATACRDGVPGVTVVMNSFGGSPEHAQYVVSVMDALPMEVHTHNAGTVQSAAGIIYLAGRKRIASPDSTFMFHATTLNAAAGAMTSAHLALHQSSLAHADAVTLDAITARSGRSIEDVRPLVIGDRLHSAEFGQEFGFVDEVRPLEISPGARFFQILL